MSRHGQSIYKGSDIKAEAPGHGRLLNTWRWVDAVCIDCGQTFTKRSTAGTVKRCEACTTARREYRRDGHKLSVALTRKWRAEGRPCELCGLRGSITHHRIRLADGGGYGEDNLMFLCGACHDLQHYGQVQTKHLHEMLDQIIIP